MSKLPKNGRVSWVGHTVVIMLIVDFFNLKPVWKQGSPRARQPGSYVVVTSTTPTMPDLLGEGPQGTICCEAAVATGVHYMHVWSANLEKTYL
jgi:hypothetical protein